MSKTREESLEEHHEWCQHWYGQGSYIYEESGYMILEGADLDLTQVIGMRDDGWLLCGELKCGTYLFTWEGE